MPKKHLGNGGDRFPKQSCGCLTWTKPNLRF